MDEKVVKVDLEKLREIPEPFLDFHINANKMKHP